MYSASSLLQYVSLRDRAIFHGALKQEDEGKSKDVKPESLGEAYDREDDDDAGDSGVPLLESADVDESSVEEQGERPFTGGSCTVAEFP